MVVGKAWPVGPPSIMSGMRSPIWSRTAAAWVHSAAPCRFAEVAVMGNPKRSTTARGMAAVSYTHLDVYKRQFEGSPRMITTLRRVEAGRDGAVSMAGSAAGMAAAVIVAAAGTFALSGSAPMFWISAAGGAFGLFFDSLLGATLEEAGWLNNDMVNFLSTGSAAAFALGLLALLSLPGMPIRLGP